MFPKVWLLDLLVALETIPMKSKLFLVNVLLKQTLNYFYNNTMSLIFKLVTFDLMLQTLWLI